MASIVIPFPGWGRSSPAPVSGRVRQRPLPFPRTPRLVAPTSERVLPWAVASLLFVTAVLNFYIFQVSVVATSSYEVQRLERDRDAWRAQNEQLALELAKARSLGWVEFQAIDRLGMVRGQEALFIRVSAPTVEAPARLQADQADPVPSTPSEEEEDEAASTEIEMVGLASQEPAPSILGWLTSLFDR